ncbi:MAG TPA: type VI secretion system-associated FHA domain protein TagH [Stellaceae bacterium]|jgi:type VI secretion system FHA domain protein|nr:type VI secretion system-associated FHA domain protein TagH [Stellaceae bacterium]
MPLVLNIETVDPALGQQAPRRVEVVTRLTIGRGADNDIVLPDPQRYLSKTHCIIEFNGEGGTIIDSSTNGVFLDDSSDRLPRNVPLPLPEGSVLRFGGYQISVVAVAPAAMAASAEPPRPSRVTPIPPSPHDELFGDPLEGSPLSGDADQLSPRHAAPFDFGPSGNDRAAPMLPDDIDDIFKSEPSPPPAWPAAAQEDHVPSAQVFFTPPKLASSLIPDDWDESEFAAAAAPKAPARKLLPEPPVGEPLPAREAARPAVMPAAAPTPQRSESAGDGAAVASFLAAVGLGDVTLSDAEKLRLMRQVGDLLGTMIQGLIEILAARASTKQEFRIERTMIGALRNNPLKFSGNVEEALRVMLLGNAQGFLPAKEAVEEALGDIKSHQLAMLAGMQVTLARVIGRFDPDKLEKRLEQKSLIEGILPAARKARYWELFRSLYKEIGNELEEDFQKAFGADFARAYRDQIDRL